MFVNDASVFIRYFGGAIATSAPHIYLSALPFAPASSLVSASYLSLFPQILQFECGQLSHWPSLELTITVGSKVNSIALSWDGQHIASGSEDGTICVWDFLTGEAVVGPFAGHRASIWSVAFSPDGQFITSGSKDHTICVWDATTGESVVGPCAGHTDQVFSVAFSPDGQHIISAQ